MMKKVIRKTCVIGIFSLTLLLCGCIKNNNNANNVSNEEETVLNGPFEIVEKYNVRDGLIDNAYALKDRNTGVMYWYIVTASSFDNAKSGFSVMYNENGEVMLYSEYLEKEY